VVLRGALTRACRFLTSAEFLRHPIRSVSRRVVWHAHWQLRSDKPFTVDYVNGLKLKLAHSSASSGIYLNRGFSDALVAELFAGALRPGMVAFDIGAHIGEYTVLFGQAVGGDGSVHAFEPDPKVLPFLRENISLNGLSNVVVNGLAVSDAQGIDLFTPQLDATASSLTRFATLERGSVTLEVPTTTLDAYVTSAGIRALDALKIDAEGAELAILKGGAMTLRTLRPSLVFAECHSAYLAASAEALLRDLGYEVDVERSRMYPHLRAWSAGAK
jgi:FkbM family methyltransferase